jgi:CPA2 family monovalent cation:H+ antiporter-2
VRTHNEEEARLLREDTGGTVFIGEHELAKSMTRHVLETLENAPLPAH